MKKSLAHIPKLHQPSRQHQDISTQHGNKQISCNNCHDAGRSNFLRSTEKFPASFNASSPVCQRCHQDIFADWAKGMHGKRTGSWLGDKKLAQCIDCHQAHHVKFESMKADPKPEKPKFGIDKH